MLAGVPTAARATPGANLEDGALTAAERRHAAGLMRVNHTGEVCAQALYAAQAVLAIDPRIKHEFAAAAREEEEHLAWTQQRLAELDDHPSLLNPLWYAGSFAIGIAAGFAGDRDQPGLRRRNRAPGRGTPHHPHGAPPRRATRRAAPSSRKCATTKRGMAPRPGRPAPPSCRSPCSGIMRVAADVMRFVAYRV